MTDPAEANTKAPSPFVTGALCRCPRCGKGKLFRGYLSVPERCSHCGLDFTGMEQADGPATFIILIVGAVTAFSALYVEVNYRPPIWLHMTMWIPMILAGALGLLRPFKAFVIALQYKHKAGEATVADVVDADAGDEGDT